MTPGINGDEEEIFDLANSSSLDPPTRLYPAIRADARSSGHSGRRRRRRLACSESCTAPPPERRFRWRSRRRTVRAPSASPPRTPRSRPIESFSAARRVAAVSRASRKRNRSDRRRCKAAAADKGARWRRSSIFSSFDFFLSETRPESFRCFRSCPVFTSRL